MFSLSTQLLKFTRSFDNLLGSMKGILFSLTLMVVVSAKAVFDEDSPLTKVVGEEELNAVIAEGTTFAVFLADHCGPCHRMLPQQVFLLYVA